MTTIIILVVVGIVSLLAELVLPGGIIGAIGGVCLIAAVVMIFATYGSTAGSLALVVLLFLSVIILWLWMKFFHRLPVTRKLMLNEAVGKDSALTKLHRLKGATGVAVTPLQPSGRIVIDGERIDAIAQGPAIPKDSKVLVIDVRSASLLVRALREDEQG